MSNKRLQGAIARAAEATATARSLEAARSAFYRQPCRKGLLGMVALAVWDGFALELATTLLGLCGRGEFPTEAQRERALLYMFASIAGETEADREELTELWVLLGMARSNEPAALTSGQMEILGSLLSWAAPEGAEAEAFLCEQFPDTLSLAPVFRRKLEAQIGPEDNPWAIINAQGELIAALRLKIAESERVRY